MTAHLLNCLRGKTTAETLTALFISAVYCARGQIAGLRVVSGSLRALRQSNLGIDHSLIQATADQIYRPQSDPMAKDGQWLKQRLCGALGWDEVVVEGVVEAITTAETAKEVEAIVQVALEIMLSTIHTLSPQACISTQDFEFACCPAGLYGWWCSAEAAGPRLLASSGKTICSCRKQPEHCGS